MNTASFQSLENPAPRALFLIGAFFPRPSGATWSALRLAQGLRERGVAVEFLVNDEGPDWREGGQYDGFPVRSFSVYFPGKLSKLRGLVRITRHLRARRRDHDLLHIHGGGYVNLFLSWWAALLTGRPSILKITSDGWDTPDGMSAEKWGSISLFAYRRLAGIIAMTSGQAEKCRAWKLPGKITVIPNGVDCERFHPATPDEKAALRDELQIPRDAFVLAYVGWLGRGKGTDILLDVFARLRERHENIFLLLVGNYLAAGAGREGGEVEIPDSPSIRIVGRTDHVERHLRAADIFVFPSRREGFGTVQIEAMACGLPCVVNDLPGVSCDIYPDDSCGCRIAENRVEDYVARIERLIADPALRESIGRAARTRAEQFFSSRGVAARCLDFYHELLAGKKSAGAEAS